MPENEEPKGDKPMCCGGSCGTPNAEPVKSAVPPATQEQELDPKPQIFVPEGLEINLDVGTDDLKERLNKIFADAKAKADEKTNAPETPLGADVVIDDFVTVELPNGMTAKVHKDSHKSKQEDMNKLMEAAGGELDCSEEDENGKNLNFEAELAKFMEKPAQSDYKAGQLRDLKNKFYPEDDSGKKAQERLENREQSDAEVRARFRREDAKLENGSLWNALQAIAEAAIKQQEEQKVKRLKKGVEAPNKRVEVMWSENPLSMFRIDWKRFSDPDFRKIINNELRKEHRTVQLENGWTVSVPEDVELDAREKHVSPDEAEKLAEQKLDKIFKAATVEAKNCAGEKRAERTLEKNAAIYAERERIRKLTDDIIPISPIENPSLVRRAVRTIRRTWKRLFTARQAFIKWWRL